MTHAIRRTRASLSFENLEAREMLTLTGLQALLHPAAPVQAAVSTPNTSQPAAQVAPSSPASVTVLAAQTITKSLNAVGKVLDPIMSVQQPTPEQIRQALAPRPTGLQAVLQAGLPQQPQPQPQAQPAAAPASSGSGSSGIHVDLTPAIIQVASPSPTPPTAATPPSSTLMGPITMLDGAGNKIGVFNPATIPTPDPTHIGRLAQAMIDAGNKYDQMLKTLGIASPQPGSRWYQGKLDAMKAAGSALLKTTTPNDPTLFPDGMFQRVEVSQIIVYKDPHADTMHTSKFGVLLGGDETKKYLSDNAWARIVVDVIGFMPALVLGAGVIDGALAAGRLATAITTAVQSLPAEASLL